VSFYNSWGYKVRPAASGGFLARSFDNMQGSSACTSVLQALAARLDNVRRRPASLNCPSSSETPWSMKYRIIEDRSCMSYLLELLTGSRGTLYPCKYDRCAHGLHCHWETLRPEPEGSKQSSLKDEEDMIFNTCCVGKLCCIQISTTSTIQMWNSRFGLTLSPAST
jgi:hypothetical protein